MKPKRSLDLRVTPKQADWKRMDRGWRLDGEKGFWAEVVGNLWTVYRPSLIEDELPSAECYGYADTEETARKCAAAALGVATGPADYEMEEAPL